jgi:hypothetical protein
MSQKFSLKSAFAKRTLALRLFNTVGAHHPFTPQMKNEAWQRWVRRFAMLEMFIPVSRGIAL